MDHDNDIENLLARAAQGNRQAIDSMSERLYTQLRQIARRFRSKGGTMDSVAILHEAWLRMVGGKISQFENELHFVKAMTMAMRTTLVDYVRSCGRLKRGGDWGRLPFDDLVDQFEARAHAPILDLTTAIDELRAIRPRQADVVEFRFFGGLTVEEIAEVWKVSKSTIERAWLEARVWLHDKLEQQT